MEHTHHHHLPDPIMGMHGMVILGGTEHVYMLHLAMRTHPAHRFQVIVRVRLHADERTRLGDPEFAARHPDLSGMTAHDIYLADRAHGTNQGALYTLRPTEVYPVVSLIDGSRTTFRGDVLRGHFERTPDAPALLRDAVIHVERLLYAQPLSAPGTPHPRSEGRLSYLLFGSGAEFFLSHQITFHGSQGAMDDNAFHQVHRLAPLDAARLRLALTDHTAQLDIDAGVATERGRLPTTGASFAGQLRGLIEGSDAALPLSGQVGPEHYLEVLM